MINIPKHSKTVHSSSDSALHLRRNLSPNYFSLFNQITSLKFHEQESVLLSSIRSIDTIYPPSFNITPSELSESKSESAIHCPSKFHSDWGWVIVLAAFFVHMITDGVPVSFGIFLDELSNDFNESFGMTSWVGSFAYGVPCLAAPIASILITRYGCRRVCVVGGFVSAFGCSLSFFSTSIFLLILTFGLLSGVGSSLSSTAALVIVSQHFKGHRATATGLSVAGTGVGAFIFAPIVNGLIDLYTWRGAMLIISGIFANLIVCGVLMRPIESSKDFRRRHLLACMEVFAKESDFALLDVYNKSFGYSTEYKIKLLGELLTSSAYGNCPASLLQQDNFESSENSSDEWNMHFSISRSMEYNNKKVRFPGRSDSKNSEIEKIKNGRSRRFSCSPQIPELAFKNHSPLATDPMTLCLPYDFNDQSTYIKRICSVPICYDIPLYNDRNFNYPETCIYKTHSDNQLLSQNYAFRYPALFPLPVNYHSTELPLHTLIKLLIFRRSFLFQHSIDNKLRKAQSMPQLIGSNVGSHNTHKRTDSIFYFLNRVLHGQSVRIHCISISLDMSFLENLHFSAFLLSNLLLYFWCNATYFFLAIDATLKGISGYFAALLFSIIGASDMIGEVLFGWSADQKCSNTLLLYICSALVCGLSTMMNPLASSFASLVCYSIVFGFTMAANWSLCPALVIEFVGFNRLVSALGVCLFCQGISSILGPPCIGYIIDATGSVNVAFVCSGAGVICAGLFMVPTYILSRKK